MGETMGLICWFLGHYDPAEGMGYPAYCGRCGQDLDQFAITLPDHVWLAWQRGKAWAKHTWWRLKIKLNGDDIPF